jgi:hypothetical protein
MKKLIQVHSKIPRYKVCSCCDETTEAESTVWYKELGSDGGSFGFQTYLECCKGKVGIVIDWYNVEDYEKTIGYINVGGRSIRQIAGYISRSGVVESTSQEKEGFLPNSKL